jgi:hypothetical protein
MKTQTHNKIFCTLLLTALITTIIMAATPTPASALPLETTLTLISGSTTIELSASDLLSMPSYTGVGAVRSGGSISYSTVGNYTGIPLLYLCNLVGGLTSSSLVTLTASDGYFTSLNYDQVHNNVFTQYNISTNTVISGQNPLIIVAYAVNGTELPGSDSPNDLGGPLRDMVVSNNGTSTIMANDGMATFGNIMCKYLTTITVSNPPSNPLLVKTCDSSGVAKSSFDMGEDVYLTATGLCPSTTYPLYIVDDVATWTVRVPIPSSVTGTATSISTDASGNIPPTSIFSTAYSGQYDIIVDLDGDGQYDEGDILINDLLVTASALPTDSVTINGASTKTFTADEILSMPTTSGWGGYYKSSSNSTGYFVGVSVQYLCNLAGGLSSSCSIQIADTDVSPYSKTFTYQQIVDAQSSSLTFYNNQTGQAQTPTQPLSLIFAYACNGSGLPSSWGSYRLMVVGSEGLLMTASYSISSIDTVTVSGYPAGYNPLSYVTCNSTGTTQSTFDLGETVYFTATGFSASTTYPVIVVSHQPLWNAGQSIPTAIATNSITTDGSGNIAATSIYNSAAPGEYDVIVDANSNGIFDQGDLLLNNVVSSAGLFVLPEYPLGAIVALIASISAFMGYRAFKNRSSMSQIGAHAKISNSAF